MMRCKTCGKEMWDGFYNECYSCRDKSYQNKVKEDIISGEEDFTSFENDVFCPWCGEVYNTDDEYDLYEDGEHELFCSKCEKQFIAEVSISYNYSTKRIDEE